MVGGDDGAEVVVCSVGLSVQHEELCEGHLEECEGGMLPWGQCGVVPQLVSSLGVICIQGSAASH